MVTSPYGSQLAYSQSTLLSKIAIQQSCNSMRQYLWVHVKCFKRSVCYCTVLHVSQWFLLLSDDLIWQTYINQNSFTLCNHSHFLILIFQAPFWWIIIEYRYLYLCKLSSALRVKGDLNVHNAVRIFMNLHILFNIGLILIICTILSQI